MSLIKIIVFLPVFLFASLIPDLSCAAKIEGRIFTESGPMKGAKVYAYRTYEDIKTTSAFAVSGAADELGQYKLQVTEGEYFLVARGSKDGKDFFSYLGGNPVNIGAGNVWISFLVNGSRPPVYSKSNGTSAVRGVVNFKGKPVKGALIAFYTSENRRFKGLGFRTEVVKEDGTFNFSLPPNNYVVIARLKKEGEKAFGPLQRGDLYCYYPGNPIEIRPDRTVQVEVPCYPKVERTSFVGSPMIKTNDYPTIENLAAAYKFGIRGKVTDMKGREVSGINVLAYKVDPANTFALATTFKGTHETENIGKSDEKGNYFIPLDADGSYVIMARYILGGGTPKAEEIYGFYNNTNRKGVTFRKGQLLDNIDITVVTPVKRVAPETDSGKSR